MDTQKPTCELCHQREAVILLYPNYAAYNASGDRPRQGVCGDCLPVTAVRVSPFAFVNLSGNPKA